MSGVQRTRRADLDLKQIWLYVAERNYPAADRLIDRMEKTLDLLHQNPLAGESMEHLRPNTRQFTVGNYVLMFEPTPSGIRLLRVAHSSRRMDDLLQADD
ncbi:MAG: type II toxin-antitoxin system RelE/ParE family toxin [Pirellulales bacterium]|nr:type II toxin-antitoxin system RelE/ParE family toxin [Pirellulales bacterium]